MSKLLSDILDVPHASLFQRIEKLERLSGKPGIDIRLASELRSLFKEKAGILGLDADDTTANELYFSMSHLALENSEELASMIGVKDDDSPREMVKKSVKFVEKRVGKRTAWCLKDSVGRKQLKQNPPKKLMKIFGFRSIDSALKRERISLFYCLAGLTEPAGWLAKYANQAAELSRSDFDNQKISISILSAKRQEQLALSGVKLKHIVYAHLETAGIEVAVPKKRFRGDVLFIIDALLANIRNTLKVSAFLRRQSFDMDFFSQVAGLRRHGLGFIESGDQLIDWPTIIYAVSEMQMPDLLKDEETVITGNELLVPSLSQLAGLGFWRHPFGAYKSKGILVSFNLSDMIVNAINNTQPEQAYTGHARRNLKNELFGRYLEHGSIREIVMDIQPKDRQRTNSRKKPL